MKNSTLNLKKSRKIELKVTTTLFVLLSSFIFSSNGISQCSSSTLVINEIMYRPSSGNGANPNAGEAIELLGPIGMDISCYVLTDGDWSITIPSGTTIGADGIYSIGNDVVAGVGTYDLDVENCACFTDGSGGDGVLILTDGGEYVALFDNSGAFIQGVIYDVPTGGNTPPNGSAATAGAVNLIGFPGCLSSVTIPAAGSFEVAPAVVLNGTSLIRTPDGTGTWDTLAGGSINSCNACVIPRTDTQIACDSFVWMDGVTYFSDNTTATYNISAASSGAPCDTLVTLNLTINTVDETTTTTGFVISANAVGTSYRWLDCNDSYAMILGETNSSYTAIANGDYAVEVTGNGCVDTSLCVAITTVGLEENALFENVKVYPNPSKGRVNIDLANLSNVNITVFNVLGEIVYESENINTPTHQFSLTGDAGVYILELNSNGTIQRYRIVKK